MGWNIIVVLGINLVFGFSASGIDNSGHLGGLAGGFLAD
jgi:rhomboid protease GluP